jgi:multiple sugar transport system ATP-binding protein
VRPEDFEDASLAPRDKPHGFEFDAPIELIENMGAELYAHFRYEGGRAESAELSELAADAGTADVPSASGEENMAVARLSPESDVREGQTARLWLDTAKLHLFDPSDGSNLQHGGDRAAEGGAVRAVEEQP